VLIALAVGEPHLDESAAIRSRRGRFSRNPDRELILRDGDPGEPKQPLGGFGSTYYQYAVEIEVYVEEGDAAARDAALDDLLQQIGAALEADRPSAASPSA
jgi:hypothetical protein